MLKSGTVDKTLVLAPASSPDILFTISSGLAIGNAYALVLEMDVDITFNKANTVPTEYQFTIKELGFNLFGLNYRYFPAGTKKSFKYCSFIPIKYATIYGNSASDFKISLLTTNTNSGLFESRGINCILMDPITTNEQLTINYVSYASGNLDTPKLEISYRLGALYTL